MLDILDKYKVSPQILEQLQKQARDQSNDADLNTFHRKLLELKESSMNNEKGFCVQHRREYYNDFEDCLRDYKNAKLKSIQKQTKVHLSDGDNGDSDSEYVDCTEPSELRHQSTHKSMPHVSSEHYHDNICQQLEPKPKPPVKRLEAKIQTKAPTQSPTAKAQLNTNYDVLQAKHSTTEQLTSHNNNNKNNNNLNQIIDTTSNCNSSLLVKKNDDSKVTSSEKSIAIDDKTPIASTSIDDDIKLHVNQSVAVKQSKSNEAVKSTPVQIVVKEDERQQQTKRKSCRKKQEVVAVGAVKDPSQR